MKKPFARKLLYCSQRSQFEKSLSKKSKAVLLKGSNAASANAAPAFCWTCCLMKYWTSTVPKAELEKG